MSPGEIAGLASGGYVTAGLAAARFAYHNFEWESYNSDTENVVFSCFQLIIWPFTLLFFVLANVVAAPTRSERRAARVKKAAEVKAARDAEIRKLERELGIGQPIAAPVVAVHPIVRVVKAAMGIPPKMPDHRCSLCIPGQPAANCPFNSICQK